VNTDEMVGAYVEQYSQKHTEEETKKFEDCLCNMLGLGCSLSIVWSYAIRQIKR